MREVLVQVLMAADLPMELLAAAVLFCLPLAAAQVVPLPGGGRNCALPAVLLAA